MTHRIPRVNHLIQKEISELLRLEVKDPRLSTLVSVTAVSTAPDLSYARVHVSIMGTDEEKEQALSGLRAAEGFLRRELGDRLQMKRVPRLEFARDDSIERGARVLELINKATRGEPESP